MRIFLPRIPISVSQGQLRQFCSEVLDKKFKLPFTAGASLDSCEILSIADEHGTEEHHGLIAITPESAAHWFITNVRGKMLGKKRMLGREYVDRKHSPNYPQEDDRRNPDVTVEKVIEKKIEVEALEQFRKEYN